MGSICPKLPQMSKYYFRIYFKNYSFIFDTVRYYLCVKLSVDKTFDLMWRGMFPGIKLVPEYKFHDSRMWRFDFAHPESKTAFEIEGGIWINGRHNRGSGFINDMIKYNEAAINGWTVIRLCKENLKEPLLCRVAQMMKIKLYEKDRCLRNTSSLLSQHAE